MTNARSALFIAIAITMFLAFIDEGYNSFAWMMDPGSWVAVGIYVVLFFLVFFLLFGLLLGKFPMIGKAASITIVSLVAVSMIVLSVA